MTTVIGSDEVCLTVKIEISESHLKNPNCSSIIWYKKDTDRQVDMKLFLSREIRDKHGNKVKSLCILNTMSNTWKVTIVEQCKATLIPPKSLVKDVMIVSTYLASQKLYYQIQFKKCTNEEEEELVYSSDLEWARHVWINMYTSSEHRDAIISCNDGQMIVHRFALASASPVMQAAFTHGAEAFNGVLNILDMDKRTLEVVIRYIYCGVTEVKPELCEKVMAAAEKYVFPRLKSAAETRMCELVNANNVIHYYKVARLFRLEDLKKNCLTTVAATDFVEVKSYETIEDLPLLQDIVTSVTARALCQTEPNETKIINKINK